jgi:outer membrane protein assembly factor BamB
VKRLALLALFGCVTAGCADSIPPPAERANRFVAPETVLAVRWRRHLTEEPLIEYKPQEFAAASSDGRRVFVGSTARVFYAFDARDGSILWHKDTDGAVTGRPRYLAESNTVLVGTDGGALYALDASTGRQRWKYQISGPIDTEPTYSDGVVYFSSGENRIYAIDAEKGTWKWQYDRESPESFTIRGYAAPLVLGGRVYAGFSDGYLACLNAGTGDVIWARSLAGDATRFMDVDSTPLYADGTLYVSSFAGGVFALDPKDGSTRWRYEVEGAGSVEAAGGRVYFSAAKAGLHCLDREGRLLWRQALAQGGELSTPLLVDGYVLVSSSTGGTYVADAVTGHLYQFFFPGHGVTGAPTTDGRQVYVLSNGGYFYAMQIRGARAVF